MCRYANFDTGECMVDKEKCPYLFFCNRINSYKESKFMPDKCKISKSLEIPKGFYKVSYSKFGKLYVEIDGYINIIDNPYDYTPEYVKVSKLKSGKLKIRQSMG